MENYTTKLGNTECSLFEGGIPLAIFGGVVVFLRSLLLRGGGGWVSFGGRPWKMV